MPVEFLGSDWDGTLIVDKDVGKLWKRVGFDLLKSSETPSLKRVELGITVVQLYALSLLYKRGLIGYDRVYGIYNRRVLSDAPVDVIAASIDKYIEKAVHRVDVETIRAIQNHDCKRFILSAGVDYAIRRLLERVDAAQLFSYIMANPLVASGNGSRFELRVNRNKGEILQRFAQERGYDLGRTGYAGDSEDDEPCFRMVRYPIVSRFAPESFKEKWAREGAYVIENAADFSRFLAKA